MIELSAIIRAHDLMHAIHKKEIDLGRTCKDFARDVHITLDVLCWVLGHDSKYAFEKRLADIRERCEELGIVEMRVQ